MAFATPILLLLLIPWAGLAVYLLVGRRTTTSVPFVELWRGMKGSPRVERLIQPPPRAVIFVLLCILLAILAGSGPVVLPWRHRSSVVVLVDNGATLSPSGRLASLVDNSGRELSKRFGFCDITLERCVGDEVLRTEASDLSGIGHQITAYPVDTADVLHARLARLLQDQRLPIIVLTDRSLKTKSDRVYQIAPQSTIPNVSIVNLSVREWPLGQLMLRLRNDSPLVECGVEIITRQLDIQRKISLPPPGEVKDYFFDLAEVGAQVKVSLEAADDFAMDNSAFLIRTAANPRMEIRGNVEPAVRRMIDVYAKHRPPSDSSESVIVGDSLFQLPSTRAVAAVSSASTLKPLRGPLQVEMSHPLIHSIDWGSVDRATVAGTSPGDGWTPIVRSNDLVLLAVRETPARQVWVGFNSPSFEATRDFVILWTNIFGYLGEGGAQIGYEKIAPLAPSTLPPVSPGIYQRSDGTHVAMNLVDVKFNENPQSLTWLPSELPASVKTAGWKLTPWLSLLAMGCLTLAVMSLKSR